MKDDGDLRPRHSVIELAFFLLLWALSCLLLLMPLLVSPKASLTMEHYSLEMKKVPSDKWISALEDVLVLVADYSKDLSYERKQKSVYYPLSDKKYTFGYRSWCIRQNTTQCFWGNGFDIVKVVLADMGTYLGELSNVERPSEFGQSLALAYSYALEELSTALHDSKDVPLDKKKVQVVSQLVNVARYSRLMIALRASNGVLMALILVVLSAAWASLRARTSLLVVACVLCAIFVTVLLLLVVAEYYVGFELRKVLGEIGVSFRLRLGALLLLYELYFIVWVSECLMRRVFARVSN